MRLAVYTDYEYRCDGTRRYGQRAFVVFLEALRPHVDRLVLVGRLDPRPGRSHYPLHEDTELLGLPHYESLAHPLSVARSLLASVVRSWRLLGEVDTAWVLGPYPHSVLLAALTLLRRRRLILGVRQDFPLYVRSRRPGRRWMHLSADLLEAIWRLLARRHAVVVVGPELERKYREAHARSVLASTVSLVSERDLVRAREAVGARDYDGELTVLTVGRLDAEKNPLLLADMMKLLHESPPRHETPRPHESTRPHESPQRWRLLVCGDGPLRERLQDRISELGLNDSVELLGYLPIDGGLLELYRSSHLFLHVSLTEGFPQVLVEAFASGLPTVATAVGGVRAAAAGAALLIEPSDARAAADALELLASDRARRDELIEAGFERARGATLEAESARVAAFLRSAP